MSDEYELAIAISPLRVYAHQSHELFTELVGAGFNDDQATKIIIGLSVKRE